MMHMCEMCLELGKTVHYTLYRHICNGQLVHHSTRMHATAVTIRIDYEIQYTVVILKQ